MRQAKPTRAVAGLDESIVFCRVGVQHAPVRGRRVDRLAVIALSHAALELALGGIKGVANGSYLDVHHSLVRVAQALGLPERVVL